MADIAAIDRLRAIRFTTTFDCLLDLICLEPENITVITGYQENFLNAKEGYHEMVNIVWMIWIKIACLDAAGFGKSELE